MVLLVKKELPAKTWHFQANKLKSLLIFPLLLLKRCPFNNTTSLDQNYCLDRGGRVANLLAALQSVCKILCSFNDFCGSCIMTFPQLFNRQRKWEGWTALKQEYRLKHALQLGHTSFMSLLQLVFILHIHARFQHAGKQLCKPYRAVRHKQTLFTRFRVLLMQNWMANHSP